MGHGPIDPFSEYSLHDVVDGTMPEPEDYGDRPHDFPVTSYYGFHVTYLGDGEYQIVYDGHVGRVKEFEDGHYEDVLELVADLTDLVLEVIEEDMDHLVSVAGKQITHDEEKANENPQHYLHIPEREGSSVY